MIAFCEERKLTDLVSGLKTELKGVRKSSSATLKPLAKSSSGKSNGKTAAAANGPAMGKEDQRRTLMLITNALRGNERKKNREEVKKIVRKNGPSGYEPPPKKPDPEE